MFTQIGTFITGWVWDPVTGIASGYFDWIWASAKRLIG